jgi:choline dehydrogenase-like flavoprotein
VATQKTDVVIVGAGAVGGIMAAELGKVGMKVIALERGAADVVASAVPLHMGESSPPSNSPNPRFHLGQSAPLISTFPP